MLTIGDVVKDLKEDYPEVSISKIRFLENQGLINPSRTSTGYRKFSTRDLERLKVILKLQRDSFLPLNVIKERLEKGQAMAGIESSEPDFESMSGDGPEGATMQEVVSITGFDAEQIRELEEFGILQGESADGHTVYNTKSVTILKAAKILSDYGIEPRHIRMYHTFVVKETGLFEQILSPQLRSANAETRKKGMKVAEELFKASMAIKRTLLEQSISEMMGGGE